MSSTNSSRDASPVTRERRRQNAPDTSSSSNDPPAYNKCFVVSALVLFLAMAWSSAPTLLSGNNPQKASKALEYQRQQQQQQAAALASPLSPLSVPSPPPPLLSLNTISKMSPEEALAAISALVSASDVATPSSEVKLVISTVTGGGKVQAEKSQQEAWKAVWSVTKFIFNGLVKIIMVIYWSLHFIVAKPLHVIAVVAEPPLTMLRDMYKAFLPVYSFFAFAAVIGVVMGGFATWIGQLLISAIGAAPESEEQLQLQQRHQQRAMMEMQQERSMRTPYRMPSRVYDLGQ
ncbi:hypothetical protein BGZ83_003775 [Gryganskiella cystojenkinii]|nr:hypothetical protein BGZ83_003775 [Gryganskiella cystojenkinii]